MPADLPVQPGKPCRKIEKSIKRENMKSKANVLLVTIDGGGNLPPVLGIAKELSKAGRRISVLSEPCMEDVITGLGFEFIRFRRHFTRTDRKEDIIRDWNVSPIKNPILENVVLGPSDIVADETSEAIRKTGAGLLVADSLLPNALIAAEAAGIPGIIAFHMPEYFPGPNRPPGMFGLKPGNSLATRYRDRLMTFLFHKKMNSFLPGINRTRSRYNLAPLERASDLFHRADLRLIQTLERFDFPLEPRPANVRYTGPVLDDPDWISSWSDPWPDDDMRPLVVISLSSTFQNQYAAIQSAINALDGLDIRGLVTLGPALEKDRFQVPKNVRVVSSAPHSLIFPEASLVITHAGHGTIMKALAHGLPMICLPMGRDQNDNAVKVEHHGCGIALSRKAGPEKIRNSVLRILSEASFRQSALGFREEIRSNPGTSILKTIHELPGMAGEGSRYMAGQNRRTA
jgi:MGT family glycosyltransferase